MGIFGKIKRLFRGGSHHANPQINSGPTTAAAAPQVGGNGPVANMQPAVNRSVLPPPPPAAGNVLPPPPYRQTRPEIPVRSNINAVPPAMRHNGAAGQRFAPIQQNPMPIHMPLQHRGPGFIQQNPVPVHIPLQQNTMAAQNPAPVQRPPSPTYPPMYQNYAPQYAPPPMNYMPPMPSQAQPQNPVFEHYRELALDAPRRANIGRELMKGALARDGMTEEQAKGNYESFTRTYFAAQSTDSTQYHDDLLRLSKIRKESSKNKITTREDYDFAQDILRSWLNQFKAVDYEALERLSDDELAEQGPFLNSLVMPSMHFSDIMKNIYYPEPPEAAQTPKKKRGLFGKSKKQPAQAPHVPPTFHQLNIGMPGSDEARAYGIRQNVLMGLWHKSRAVSLEKLQSMMPEGQTLGEEYLTPGDKEFNRTPQQMYEREKRLVNSSFKIADSLRRGG